MSLELYIDRQFIEDEYRKHKNEYEKVKKSKGSTAGLEFLLNKLIEVGQIDDSTEVMQEMSIYYERMQFVALTKLLSEII